MLTDSRQFLSVCQELTVAKCLDEGTQLSSLRASKDYKKVMHRLLENLQGFYQVKNPLPAPVLAETVEMITKDFWWMKFEEIIYVFLHARSGKYGTLFELGSPSTIRYEVMAEWLRRYDQMERVPLIEARALSERGKREGTGGQIEDIKEAYKRFLAEGLPQPPKRDSNKWQAEETAFKAYQAEYLRQKLKRDEDTDDVRV